jgi:hypothetical protein
MMIPTEVVTLKLHDAKSRAAFLSDFLREAISTRTHGFTSGSLNQNLLQNDTIRIQESKLELRGARR